MRVTVNFEKSTIYNGGNAGVCLKTAMTPQDAAMLEYCFGKRKKIYLNGHKYLQ